MLIFMCNALYLECVFEVLECCEKLAQMFCSISNLLIDLLVSIFLYFCIYLCNCRMALYKFSSMHRIVLSPCL